MPRLRFLSLFRREPIATPKGPSPSPRGERSDPAPIPGEEVPPAAALAIAAAKQHLAARLSRSEMEIALGKVEYVEWRDASLGCPKPGMVYAQVITPGFRIILLTDGITYEYHSDLAGRIVPCS